MTPPHYADDTVTLHHGDCIDVLRALPDNSVDSIVTDPPYGLEFMGKEWDSFGGKREAGARGGDGNKGILPGYGRGGVNADVVKFKARSSAAFGRWCELWATECLRVLKPGGHLLAFGGTRTWHRLAVAVEDAGFEIRDSIAWLYGSGFGKAGLLGNKPGIEWCECGDASDGPACPRCGGLGPAFKGFSTALKPAFEPVVVGRKPLTGTVAANVTAWGTGALNINACRIGDGSGSQGDRPTHEASSAARYADSGAVNFAATPGPRGGSASGRWPANVCLDEGQAATLDQQSGVQRDGVAVKRNLPESGARQSLNVKATSKRGDDVGYGSGGGASRFFYCAKAPKSERPMVDGVSHATVKPLTLMRWLVRLVTPPGGVVLEPFAGSGATVEACILEGFRCVAIERGDEYLPLILARIERAHATVEASAATAGDLLDLDFGT